jgi:hypothetical protein
MRWRVSFDVNLPDDVTADQVQEWVNYELHWNGSMDGKLADRLGEIEPVHAPDIEARRNKGAWQPGPSTPDRGEGAA